MTTGPVNKQAWARAGLRWRGHTELPAELTGAGDVRMMFHAGRLLVVLATVHVPLAHVPALLTRERLETTLALAHAELPRFGVARPRLALAGLNPHAGENGLIGDEEQKVFGPAVESCRARGVDVSDPIPGDAVFRRAAEGEFYAVSAGPSTSPWACRKARHDYHVFDTYEAGVVLLGTEVKAIREGRVNLKDSYGKVEAGEVVLHNLHVSPPTATAATPSTSRCGGASCC